MILHKSFQQYMVKSLVFPKTQTEILKMSVSYQPRKLVLPSLSLPNVQK